MQPEYSSSSNLITDEATLTELASLCRTGRLFDVMEWIEKGKPINLPIDGSVHGRIRSPLHIALEHGFHSLAELLLRSGAFVHTDAKHCPMKLSLQMRRFDFVQLLVKYGYDMRRVSMADVFETWNPEIMRFAIELGADCKTDMPLARALSNRIDTAVGVFKQYRGTVESFQEQGEIALRYHCREGNQKWASMLLWAGADPYRPGGYDPVKDPAGDYGELSAIGFAAALGHLGILPSKRIVVDAASPVAKEILRHGSLPKGFTILQNLFKEGLEPNDLDNGGCSRIQTELCSLRYSPGWESHLRWGERPGDTKYMREEIKSIHFLVKHGAKWRPIDRKQISTARGALLTAIPDYVTEFVWIMWKYAGANRADVVSLIDTPAMKRHTEKYRARIFELLESWPAQAAT